MESDKYEAELKELINNNVKSSEIPFLGLFSDKVTPEMSKAVGSFINQEKKYKGESPCKSYINGLKKYPALFAVYFASELNSKMGRENHFEIYPEIQKVIASKGELKPPEKQDLGQAFRKAVSKLGLYPVPLEEETSTGLETYKQQVSIPAVDMKNLIGKMINFTDKIGRIDPEDKEYKEDCRVWQEEFCDQPYNKPPQIKITVADALKSDKEAYYTATFFKVWSDFREGVSFDQYEEGSPEALIFQALQEAKANGNLKEDTGLQKRPFIFLEDGYLKAFIPEDKKVSLIFHNGNSLSPTEEDKDEEGNLYLLSFEKLIKELKITEKYSSEKTLPVWQDESSNNCLIFSKNGRLKALATLEQEKISLPPGEYDFLSRFAPQELSENEIDQRDEMLSFYIFSVTLNPGEKRKFSRKGIKYCLELEAEPVPLMKVVGSAVEAKNHEQVFYKNCMMQLKFPEKNDASYGTTGQVDQESFAGDYDLHLVFNGQNAPEIYQFTMSSEETEKSFDITGLVEKFFRDKPICAGLELKITKRGEQRAFRRLKEKFFYWNGLDSVTEDKNYLIFKCHVLPDNQIHEKSDFYTVNNEEKTLQSVKNERFLKLAFHTEKGMRELVFFCPGEAFIKIVSFNENSEKITETVVLGAAEEVSAVDDRTFLITFGHAGQIKLGDWCEPVKKRECRKIPATRLCELSENVCETDNEGRELIFNREAAPPLTLLALQNNSHNLPASSLSVKYGENSNYFEINIKNFFTADDEKQTMISKICDMKGKSSHIRGDSLEKEIKNASFYFEHSISHYENSHDENNYLLNFRGLFFLKTVKLTEKNRPFIGNKGEKLTPELILENIRSALKSFNIDEKNRADFLQKAKCFLGQISIFTMVSHYATGK